MRRGAAFGAILLIGQACGFAVEVTETEHDWILTAADGRELTLVVAVGSPNCDRLDRVDVVETDESVSVTAVVMESEAARGLFASGCDLAIDLEEVTVELATPLAGRSVLGCAPEADSLGNYFSDERSSLGSSEDDCSVLSPDAAVG